MCAARFKVCKQIFDFYNVLEISVCSAYWVIKGLKRWHSNLKIYYNRRCGPSATKFAEGTNCKIVADYIGKHRATWLKQKRFSIASGRCGVLISDGHRLTLRRFAMVYFSPCRQIDQMRPPQLPPSAFPSHYLLIVLSFDERARWQRR
jgi:hypothetical protein